MRFLKLATASVLTLSMLAGCGGSGSADAGNKVFTVAKTGDIMTLDSTQAYDSTSLETIHLMTEGLLGVNSKGKMGLMLAKSYKVSKNKKKYTFKLKDGLKWTDTKGKTYPLKASDFVYSWRKALSGEYSYIIASDGAGVKNADKIIAKGAKATDADRATLGVKAKDDKTLVVNLERACPYFLNVLTYPVFYPQCEAFAKKAGNKYAMDVNHMVSCGAFMPKTWTKGSRIEFTKNKNYFDAKNVKLDGVTFLLAQDFKTASAAFEAGKVDYAPINSSLVDKYKGKKEYRVDHQGFVSYLNFNFKRKKFQNLNLRRALSYAIDREDLTKNILKDGSTPAEGIVGRGMCYDPTNGKDLRDENGNFMHYDMKKAQSYLNKALKQMGKKSIKIQLLYSTNEIPCPQIAEYLQNKYKKLKGLDIQMKATVRQGRIDLQAKKDFDMTILNWGPDYADPTTYLNIALSDNSNNRGAYDNPKYDALLKKAQSTLNEGKRWKILLKAEKMFNTQLPDVPIHQFAQSCVVNPHWHNLIYRNAMGAAYTYTYMYKD